MSLGLLGNRHSDYCDHMAAPLAVTVRAKPGSHREHVTLLNDGDDEGHPMLEVRVHAKAVDGAANDAVVAALAKALGIRRSAVTIVRGHRSRLKHVAIDTTVDNLRRLPCDT